MLQQIKIGEENNSIVYIYKNKQNEIKEFSFEIPQEAGEFIKTYYIGLKNLFSIKKVEANESFNNPYILEKTFLYTKKDIENGRLVDIKYFEYKVLEFDLFKINGYEDITIQQVLDEIEKIKQYLI